MMYEVRTPDDGYAEAESNSIMGAGHALTEADMMDMAMSASGHGGRGHGYGHGHGHGHACKNSFNLISGQKLLKILLKINPHSI